MIVSVIPAVKLNSKGIDLRFLFSAPGEFDEDNIMMLASYQ